MLPRRARMHAAEIRQGLHSRRYSSPSFSAIVSENGRGCAIVVSKKTARDAVLRHRIKRRTAAALRRFAPLSISGLIVFPRASVATLPFPLLLRELEALLSKAGRNR